MLIKKQLILKQHVRFEVMVVVTMKSSGFWNVMLCGVVEIYLRFGGMYCLHLSGPKNKPSKKR
jgi:hypothetical protein